MPDTRPAELRELASTLARRAGEQALAGRRRLPAGQVVHDTKSSATDPVTEFDRAAEELIVSTLRHERTADGIVGEEGSNVAGTTGIDWHIDPIDGTVNFVYGLPTWSVSVAACDARGTVAGAVYVPATNELFTAARGEGASLNGDPIQVSTVEHLDMALVATGFNYDSAERQRQARRLTELISQVRDIRRFGSAALDLCMVACGRVDAYFEEHLHSWDLAAGSLIAVEAGAIVTGFNGQPAMSGAVVAAPGALHPHLRAAILAAEQAPE
ncbi:MAG: inositol monophosphatase family protein [Actinomycetota bacterium]